MGVIKVRNGNFHSIFFLFYIDGFPKSAKVVRRTRAPAAAPPLDWAQFVLASVEVR